MQKNFDNWCPEIYRNLFVKAFNSDQIYIAPCCQAVGSLVDVDSFDFEKNDYLDDLRRQFDNGQKPSACNSCWKMENVGHKSRRQSAIEFYQLLEPDTTVIHTGLDNSATWACNLACIMCGPQDSSTWAKELGYKSIELKQIGKRSVKENRFADKIQKQNLNRVHFNGGEPLINDDHIELLAKIEQEKSLSDLFISYNTNATIYPSQQAISLWSKAKLVKLFFSIDAVDLAFEYIRYPASWEQTADNMIRMKRELPANVMFGFNVTVGCYNLLELHDIWSWFKNNIKTNREGDPSDFCWQLADNFSLNQVNNRVAQLATTHLANIPVFGGLLHYIKTVTDSNAEQKWIQQLETIDARRGTDWRRALKISEYY